ncbi:hypothetical protein Tco_1132113 [Tanacetum coccineum]|uniref:Uncharacterized protein n=1 Tax=Tanacetum coccineum TaxID=301880 RepID=A0ABQ5JB09_9ASTR
MQTLAPQLKVEANVIDSFTAVLYHEEMVNKKGIKKKHLFHTRMIGTTVIIENSKSPQSYDTNYKKVCDLLKMSEEAHAFAKEHSDKKLKHELSWNKSSRRNKNMLPKEFKYDLMG